MPEAKHANNETATKGWVEFQSVYCAATVGFFIALALFLIVSEIKSATHEIIQQCTEKQDAR